MSSSALDSPQQSAGDRPARGAWLGLIGISLGVALIIVDTTIVNVAIPYIVRDLTLSSTDVQWVQESYTLVFAATLLVWGVLADRWGRRRVLVIGTVLFTVASLLAAVADSGTALILTRVLQGVGGAMILPTSLSLINASFTGRQRGIAFAVWGSTIGGMAAVGPLLGGWLTTAFSWRWAFGINLPLGVLVVVMVMAFVPESRGSRTGRVDWLGALLITVTFAALAFGLIEGRQYGWWSTVKPLSVGPLTWTWTLSPVAAAFLLSVVTGTLFVIRGLRRTAAGRPSLVDFALFRIRRFRNGNIVAAIVSLGEFGILLALPIWLQNVLGYTALQTGLVLLALAVGSFAASGLSIALQQRLSPVTIVQVGVLAEMLGVAGIGVVVSPTTGWVALVPLLFLYGFGVGLATAQLTGVALADVPVQFSGEGSGIQSTARQIGSALGIAVLGTVLFTTASAQLTTSLTDQGVPDPGLSTIVNTLVDSSGGAIAGFAADPTTAAAAQDAREAFSTGTSVAAYVAAAFLALGLAATVSLRTRRRVPTSTPQRGTRPGTAAPGPTEPSRAGSDPAAGRALRHRV